MHRACFWELSIGHYLPQPKVWIADPCTLCLAASLHGTSSLAFSVTLCVKPCFPPHRTSENLRRNRLVANVATTCSCNANCHAYLPQNAMNAIGNSCSDSCSDSFADTQPPDPVPIIRDRLQLDILVAPKFSDGEQTLSISAHPKQAGRPSSRRNGPQHRKALSGRFYTSSIDWLSFFGRLTLARNSRTTTSPRRGLTSPAPASVSRSARPSGGW